MQLLSQWVCLKNVGKYVSWTHARMLIFIKTKHNKTIWLWVILHVHITEVRRMHTLGSKKSEELDASAPNMFVTIGLFFLRNYTLLHIKCKWRCDMLSTCNISGTIFVLRIYTCTQIMFMWRCDITSVLNHIVAKQCASMQKNRINCRPRWEVNGDHYSDAIMIAMVSQINGVSIVCSTVSSCADQRTSNLCVTGLCEGNSPVDSPHKGPVTRKTFQFDDMIMTNS